MTQPSVSNHLHSLEERFGVVLLTRGHPLRVMMELGSNAVVVGAAGAGVAR